VRPVVLDPGVLVSALITPGGAPARLLTKAAAGEFELVASPRLLSELAGVLRREKFRPYVDLNAVGDYLDFLAHQAVFAPDPDEQPPLRCADPDDDYLIALAYSQNAVLVSGDSDLLDLADAAPICSPADFLAR